MKILVIVAAALGALAATALPAGATYPGTNGPVTYSKNLEPGPAIGLHEIFRRDGGVETQLTDFFPGFAINSDWSPDGARIAFDVSLDPDAPPDVWLMNPDGTGQIPLTANGAFDGYPSWSPDGEWIAFDSDGPSFPETQGIWKVRPDGSDLTRVTVPGRSALFDSEPAFSPNGEWIAFTRVRDTCRFPNRNRFIAAGCTSAIFLVRADGAGVAKRLTGWGHTVASPDWSPDGTRIAYHGCDICKQGGKLDIYVMNADGSGDRRLTSSPPWTGGPFVASGNPVWSPDGTKIIFTHWLADQEGQIMVMHADGSNVQTVTSEPAAFHNEADWGTP